MMEHILASNIMSHGENNNILYPLQHGFRRGRSCETQLIEFIDDLTSNLEEGQQTDILIMDFAKAFDKVDHSLLTHKLHHYGIRGEVNTWIKNWLKDRTQSVVVEGEKSEPVSVDSGVPQGSVLGPGCSCTTSMTFLRGSGQEYAYSLTTLSHISSLSYKRTQRHYRKTLKIWLYGRTSGTWSSTPTSVWCSPSQGRKLLSMLATSYTTKH